MTAIHQPRFELACLKNQFVGVYDPQTPAGFQICGRHWANISNYVLCRCVVHVTVCAWRGVGGMGGGKCSTFTSQIRMDAFVGRSLILSASKRTFVFWIDPQVPRVSGSIH